MSYENRKNFEIAGEMEAHWSDIAGGKITYELFPTKEQVLEQPELLVIDKNNMTKAWVQPLEVLRREENYLEVAADFSQVISEVFSPKGTRIRIYVRTMIDGEEVIYRLSCEEIRKKMKRNDDDIYFQSWSRGEPLGVVGDYEIVPYYTIYGRIGMSVHTKNSHYMAVVINKVQNVIIKGGKLKILFYYQDIEGCKPKVVSMVLRHSMSLDDMRYEAPIRKVQKEGRWTKAEVIFDLRKCKLRALYWDVYVEYESETGEVYPTKLKNFSENFKNTQFRSLFKNDVYYFGNNQIFHPYMTTVDALAFQCREKGEYDGWGFKLKERVAAGVYYVLKKYWQNKGIYLVYEKFCMMAQDNGYYFFKYCMENNMEEKLGRKIYYVIDKNSPDIEKLLPYKKNVVYFMSVKYIVYLLASKLLISTDTRNHAYAWRSNNSIMTQYLGSKKLVFLQHGVTALKKVDFLYGKGASGACNLFVVTSDFEKDIVMKNFGYTEQEVAVTGFTRWDVLEDKSEGKTREILLMPTWRNWLEEVGDDVFKQSDYYQNYMKFLTSDRLTKILEENDLTLNFYLHPKFRDYISEFKIDAKRIRLIPFGQEPLNELMMKCRLLITDYSSVCWDVYYQGKPVIFYQFDIDTYYELHGSYLDMRKDLFGPQTEELDVVFEELEKAIKADFKLEPKYEEMRHSYYKYIDDKNSQRLCEALVEKGW